MSILYFSNLFLQIARFQYTTVCGWVSPNFLFKLKKTKKNKTVVGLLVNGVGRKEEREIFLLAK